MHSIVFNSDTINYQIRYSGRAQRLGVRVLPGGVIYITCPKKYSEPLAQAFVRRHASWIARAHARMRRVAPRIQLPSGKRDYRVNKMRAIALAQARAAHFAERYNLSFNRISIKNQSSRWGSCSRKGNLNFSYKIVHLPRELADYIIIHEICHLAHFNHSRDFWNLVAKVLPAYRVLKKRLAQFAL